MTLHRSKARRHLIYTVALSEEEEEEEKEKEKEKNTLLQTRKGGSGSL